MLAHLVHGRTCVVICHSEKKLFHIQVERFQLVSLTIIIRLLQVCFCVKFLIYDRCFLASSL